jgi:hypothetical protein
MPEEKSQVQGMGEEVQGGSDMTTIRVRDLSLELGISNKDLLQLLRDSHIHVKSHMSGLTDEEVDMVKSRLAEKNRKEESAEVLQKRVSSGVVLRRKKRVVPSPEEEVAPGGGTGPEQEPEPERPDACARDLRGSPSRNRCAEVEEPAATADAEQVLRSLLKRKPRPSPPARHRSGTAGANPAGGSQAAEKEACPGPAPGEGHLQARDHRGYRAGRRTAGRHQKARRNSCSPDSGHPRNPCRHDRFRRG